MWNWLVSGLASGCTIMLFDGNPFSPTEESLLRAVDEENVTIFGTSAKYISAIEKAGIQPRNLFEYQSLKNNPFYGIATLIRVL